VKNKILGFHGVVSNLFYSTANTCTSPLSPVAASSFPSGDQATRVTPLEIFARLI
jgi:hypothetical protein